MQKYQYLLRSQQEMDPASFRARVFEHCIPELLAQDPAALKVSITDQPLPRLGVLPLRKDNLALISLWLASDDKPGLWQSGSSTCGLTVQGYQVEASAPVSYDRSWPDGQTSPGVVLLTLLKQNPKLSYDEFMHEWHGRHTPKALRIHPFWSYIRNVIQTAVIPGSPPFEGIVEEHFRQRRDCVNPVRMFGGPLKFLPHMIEVGMHAQHFLDLSQTENYLLSETHIRSPGH